MSNYPSGAEFDDSAPYNENESELRFDANVKGTFVYKYLGHYNDEDANEATREAIQDYLRSRDSNIEIISTDVSVF